MALETIFANEIFTKFAFPFLLIFFVFFAILERTKILGDDQRQLDALVSFVIALIFVSAVYPKLVVTNLILFLTVAIIVVFVVLLLWGFVFGDIKEGFNPDKWMKWVLGVLVTIAVVIAVFWAAGIQLEAFDFLFRQSWSNTFWTNAVFVLVIAAALALVLTSVKEK